MDDLAAISTYYLVIEVCENGHSGLLPDLEPIAHQALVDELKQRTGLGFDEPEDWASWFVGNEKFGSDLERANLLMYLETKKRLDNLARQIGVNRK